MAESFLGGTFALGGAAQAKPVSTKKQAADGEAKQQDRAGIVAFCIFMIVKAISSLKRKTVQAAPAALPERAKEVVLLEEIRDAIKARS